MLSFRPTFSLSSFTFIKRLFSSSSLSAIRVVSSEVIVISSGNLDSSLCFFQIFLFMFEGIDYPPQDSWASLVAQLVKNLPAVLNPGLGRSPGEGNGNPFQYSVLENSADGGAWQAIVQGVTKSQT